MTENMTIDGLTGYLVSLGAYGCGEVTCRRVAETFGADTIRVCLDEPDLLTSIEGIGQQKADAMHQAVTAKHGDGLTAKERRENRRRMQQTVFLEGIGVHGWMLARILNRYGDKAEQRIREDPYLLTELDGFGFRRADKVAAGLGITGSDPRRVEACVLFTLEQKASDPGHCFVGEPQLTAMTRVNLRHDPTDDSPQAALLPEVPAEVVTERLTAMADTERIIRDGEAVYLPRLYWAEIKVANTLHRMMDYRGPAPSRTSEWGQRLRDQRDGKRHTDYKDFKDYKPF